jgi:hypothetical protein
MGKAPLLWLDNLPAECITSWETLSLLFTTNYQATYNRPGNTHHLAKVQMRSDETLREYTNRYFENRNTLAGIKDEDAIAYYKKGITNIKLFEKIHEADAHTIGDLVAYVDKLVDTQDVVMHDFKREDHGDRGTRSRKRSGEAYVADPPRPSTFLEGDFNMVMDDQCQFHRDAKHTTRECEQLKRALGVPSTSKKTKSNDDRNGGQRFDNRDRLPDQRDYRDRRPYPCNDNRDRRDYRRDYRRDDILDDYRRDDRNDRCDDHRSDRRDDRHDDAATTDVATDVAKTIITAKTATGKSGHLHHRPRGATPMAHSTRPIARLTSSLDVTKRSKPTDRPDQTPGRLGTSTLKTRDLCGGLNSQSLSLGKIIGFTSLTPGPTIGRQPHS